MDMVSSICFHFMSILEDMFREFGFAFCVSEIFPMLFKSCVEVSVGSFYIKFVAVGACQFINPLTFIFVVLSQISREKFEREPGLELGPPYL